jgi:hypothetical protein
MALKWNPLTGLFDIVDEPNGNVDGGAADSVYGGVIGVDGGNASSFGG